MSTKIGHFEILSELAKSATGTVYKANDPQSNQTVALKAIQLSAFGEKAAELEKSLLEEAETTKALSHANIAPVYGAGEMGDGLFCSAMEYIQGNSIATMLARKEGFSIWDLLDIGRQVCSGLDHAHSNHVYHYSLEPGKIMCGWDGTVKILGFGSSSLGKFTLWMPAGVPFILYYMSPEQARGDAIDGRSNLFTLGAMFYEMVTDRKPFDGADTESLRQSITESIPVLPVQLNPKLNPQLSDLIMKVLSKDPEQRYQTGRQLLDDLEKCKESKPQAGKKAAPAAKATAVPGVAKPPVAKPPAPVKPAAPAITPQARPAATSPAASRPLDKKPLEKKLATPATSHTPAVAKTAATPPKAAAAAAGSGSYSVSRRASPEVDATNQFAPSVKPAAAQASQPESFMSAAAAAEPEVETPEAETPRVAVDPLMSGGGAAGGAGTSFSEISELPPLKEIYVEPPPPPPIFESQPSAPSVLIRSGEKEKPKVQPREVAEKAIKEIKSVPPKLMLYSVGAAVALIVVIAIAVGLHIYSLNKDDDASHTPAASEPVAPAAARPAAKEQPAPAQPVASASAEEPAVPEPVAAAPVRAATPAKVKNARKKAAAAVPVIVPGLITVDSTPQGAQVRLDGKADPSWITPFTISGLQPGQHSVTVSKAGYSSDTRTVDVASGNKTVLVSHLTQLMATLAVTSSPAGANVFVDGKDTGKLTPTQVGVDKGQHVVLVRKSGYIDETTSSQFVIGQTVSYSPALRPLGNVDGIKTVGKMKKIFGGGGAQGMGGVAIKTQPKGAQVAVNQHMLGKGSPVEFMLDPGNYVVDITLSGYQPLHRVITVDKGGKVVIDEVLQRE